MNALPASSKWPRSNWTSPARRRASALTRPSGCNVIICSAIFSAHKPDDAQKIAEQIIRLVGGDFHRAERQQHFRFPGGIGGGLQIFAKSIFRFIELLLLGRGVAEIEPEIRFDSRI